MMLFIQKYYRQTAFISTDESKSSTILTIISNLLIFKGENSMRPKLEQLTHRVNDQSFICYEVNVPSFDFFWHYHPEYELTCILKGKGMRLAGDSFERFEAGDLILVGPMLPHTWVTEKKTKESCSAIVIQFTHEFLEQLFKFPEMKCCEKVFAKAARGLHFNTSKNYDCVLLLQKMLQSNDLVRLTLLMQVLQQLSNKKHVPLSSVQYKPMKGYENQQRINKVFLYVEKEFKETISVKKAASLIHLSESAFCKFFKRASGKTFSEYTNEIRTAYSCRLLIETDKSISEIGFSAGFESLTYFNRVFLRKKKVTPRRYRKMNRISV
jgi:AraC-like DNA-binding protein